MKHLLALSLLLCAGCCNCDSEYQRGYKMGMIDADIMTAKMFLEANRGNTAATEATALGLAQLDKLKMQMLGVWE